MTDHAAANAQLVTSALAARDTVRITFSRAAETHSVDHMRGDALIRSIAGGLRDEDTAEQIAVECAAALGIDVSRIDVR